MEEQTKRTTLLVIAALLIVVIVFAGIFYVRSRGEKAVEPPADQAQQAEVVEQAELVEVAVPERLEKQQKPPQDTKDAQLKRFCIDFVARFGTYSTDGASMNLVQLMPLMSGELKAWADGRLASQVVSEKFSGVTTKALSAKVESQSATAAVVEVSTQRSYIEGVDTRIAYEDATVTLTYASGWRVTSVTWKAKAQ